MAAGRDEYFVRTSSSLSGSISRDRNREGYDFFLLKIDRFAEFVAGNCPSACATVIKEAEELRAAYREANEPVESGEVHRMSFWSTLPQPILGLAPMDGVTDATFRRVVASQGRPDITFTEFTQCQ